MRILLNSEDEFIVITEDNNVCSLVGGKPDRSTFQESATEPAAVAHSPSSLISTCVAITEGLRKVFPARANSRL